jgi:hypothetical protein
MRKWTIMAMAAVGFGCGGQEHRGDGHDVIKLRMATNEAESPFVDTARVVAALEYKECLQGFYEGEGAQLTADGVEGAEIFDDWSTRLCQHERLEAPAPCEVLELDQRLDAWFLGVEYEMVGELVENHRIAFGPVPDRSTAGCVPEMGPTADHQVTGYDELGEVLWTTSSWKPDSMASGDEQAIVIYAAREP